MRKKLGLIIGILSFSIASFSQTEASIDKDSILIGDQFVLKLVANSIHANKIVWPVFKDTLTQNIEIVSQSAIDTLQNKNSYLISQEFLLTSFDTGTHKIPSFEIAYIINENGEKETRLTSPMSIFVSTLEVDTSKAIMPIKGPIHSPYTFREIAPYAIGGIVLIGLIVLAIIYYKRRKNNKPLIQFKAKPKLPAHIQALQHLENLKGRKLWQDGKYKMYYTELTDIVRVYLDDRFGIEAMEMTSDEIREAIQPNEIIDKKLKEKLSETLMTADLVKFAKMTPISLENDNHWSNMKSFVESTKREEVKEIKKVETKTEEK
jgi:hypothetical protein